MSEQQPSDEHGLPRDSNLPGKRANARFNAHYQDRLHTFRASVVELFQQHEAETMEDTWMAFDTTITSKARNSDSEDGFLYGTKRLTAIHAAIDRVKKRRRQQPQLSVRLFTNESFPVEDGVEYLTTETMVHGNGTAQHLMELSWLEDNYDPLDAQTFYIPIFSANANGIGMIGELGHKTPYDEAITELDDGVVHTSPFSSYGDKTDKSYALGYAQDLVDELQGITPIVRYYPDSE